jgi:signal peptidase II
MSLVSAPSPTRLQRLLAYRLLLVLGLVTLGADQVSKAWIAAKMPYPTYGEPGAIRIVNDFFYLVHVGNTGAAWSLFTGRSTILAILAGLTLVAIVFCRHALGLRARTVQVSFGLLCGGIAGNLTDRLRFGHVIDFLDFHFGSYIYPTFNVADSAICVGVFLYIAWSIRQPASDDKVAPTK